LRQRRRHPRNFSKIQDYEMLNKLSEGTFGVVSRNGGGGLGQVAPSEAQASGELEVHVMQKRRRPSSSVASYVKPLLSRCGVRVSPFAKPKQRGAGGGGGGGCRSRSGREARSSGMGVRTGTEDMEENGSSGIRSIFWNVLISILVGIFIIGDGSAHRLMNQTRQRME
jgi:hypothetical protein